MFVNISQVLPYACGKFTLLQKYKHLKARYFLDSVSIYQFLQFILQSSLFTVWLSNCQILTKHICDAGILWLQCEACRHFVYACIIYTMLRNAFPFTYFVLGKALVLAGSKSTAGRMPAQTESLYLQFGEISSVSN